MLKYAKSAPVLTLALAALSSLALPMAAQAQKAKDTLRIAFLEATQSTDLYMDTKPENRFLGAGIWDSLVVYDEFEHHYAPLLAKSYRKIDDQTYEFELRDDVKWHDGHPFTADDVIYTFAWLTAPDTKLRYKTDWEMLSAEKIDKYKVRIKSSIPQPNTLEILANSVVIFPEHAHKPLANKETFGTKPVGTGMWKTIQVDRNTGDVFLKNPDYTFGGKAKPGSNIGRVEVIPVPDEGTQMAQFLVGNVHFLRNTPLEQAEEMVKNNPAYAMTLAQSLSYLYIQFDAAGRSGLKPVQDARVRKAMAMAISPEEVYKIRTGKNPLPRGMVESLCWKKEQEGCDYSVKPPAYDPAATKKLLTEAGYADGFDIQITTFNSTKDMAEVVVGQLRKVGIRASIDNQTFVAYRKKQADGKLNSLVTAWSAGSSADVATTLNFFFDPGPRDYFQDPELVKFSKLGLTTTDPVKRREAVRHLMDRVTEQAYSFPIAPIPLVLLHIADLKVNNLRYDSYGVQPGDLNWK